MPDKFVELFKCSFVEEHLDTFAGGELAFLVLPLAAFSTAADFRFSFLERAKLPRLSLFYMR